MRRILVTGGSGFIGTNLVEFYRGRADVHVANLDCVPPRNPDHHDLHVSGDVSDEDQVRALLREFRPTELVHLAARTDLAGIAMSDYTVNVDGLAAVLSAAGRTDTVRRAVFASTRLVCAEGVIPVCELDYFPPNPYGRSKAIGEQLVRAARLPYTWTIVRPTSVWGPWGDAPYRNFFRSLARGTYLHPGRETVRRHYGYVGNTVHQIDRLLTLDHSLVHGRTLYLADPTPTDVRAWADLIRAELGRPPVRSAPVVVLRAAGRGADVVNAVLPRQLPISSSRLRHLREDMLFDLAEVDRLVGPLPFSLDDGVRRTLAHLRDQGDLPGRG